MRVDFPGEEGNLRSENTKNCQKQGKGQQRFLPGLKRPVLSNCGLVMNLHDQHCLKHDYLCLYILLVGFGLRINDDRFRDFSENRLSFDLTEGRFLGEKVIFFNS